MGLNLVNLNEARQFMLDEIEYDITTNGKIYISTRLNPRGTAAYTGLFKEAVQNHNDVWLAEQLRSGDMFNPSYSRQNHKTGKVSMVTMPSNAPDSLAEGETNRFYIRGLSRYAIDKGIESLEIYRARASMNPRPESEARIGARVKPADLLADLRAHIGDDTALGVPGGVNSGLSVKLP